MKKQSPIEQFISIIGEENFHIFHAEYLLFERNLPIEKYIEIRKSNSVRLAFVWSGTFMGEDFWRELDIKLQKEWRD